MTTERAHPEARTALGSGVRYFFGGLAFACILYSGNLRAEDYSILYSFYDRDRGYPETGVIRDADGNLVGTLSGPPYVSVFKLAPTGNVTFVGRLYGEQGGGLTLAENGAIYGTSFGLYDDLGEEIDAGTVFKLPVSRKVRILHSFGGDPSPTPHNPLGKLAVDENNNVYGTAAANDAEGVVFRVAPDGSMQVLHTFQAGAEGGYPSLSAIVRTSAGSLFGTFRYGGLYGMGGVFKIDPKNQYSVVHSFKSGEGTHPQFGVILDNAGNIFGNTYDGGANGKGTIFKITRDGTTTTLFSFGGAQGSNPLGGLTLDAQGNLYGTASGGLHGCGTVYKVTAAGQGFTLHNFCSGKLDGSGPYGRLTSDVSGFLYGTTTYGGAHGYGTVFKLAK